MRGKKKGLDVKAALRNRAEAEVKAKSIAIKDTLSPKDMRKVFHELQVHQVELQMQNEELRRTQGELEASQARYFDLYNLAPVGYFTISKQGVILEANLTAAELLGVEKNFLNKKVFPSFLLPEDANLYYLLQKKLFELGQPQSGEFRMLRANALPFWARMDVNCVDDPDGVPVCHAVVSNITERKRAQDALLASENKYRSIVENINDALYIHDFKGTILDVNENACRMTGYNREELLGASLAKIDSPENTQLMQKHMQRLLNDGKVEFDGQHMRSDGSRVWVTVSAKIVSRLDNGIVQGFVKDITDRKRAEEKIKEALVEKELLLREVNHRVKNNLQIINSLFNLQARKVTDEGVKEILRESCSRIKSIALVHEKLYGSPDLSRIDMKEYLTSLVRSISHSLNVGRDGIYVTVLTDEGIRFDMDRVIYCGLIVNELVTNAFKYAFPDKRKGEICIELKINKSNNYELIVRDDGVGLPKDFDWEDSETLGLELVKTLAHQLGEIKLQRKGGTAFKITLHKG
ncbi:MAG: PAS domain S-box protein [Candidatus Omnitrophota bacterium]|jgi:PAS domain S-box-containing protein